MEYRQHHERIGVALDCEFPNYLVDEKIGLWLPRTIETAVGTALPMGAKVKIRGAASKPLGVASSKPAGVRTISVTGEPN